MCGVNFFPRDGCLSPPCSRLNGIADASSSSALPTCRLDAFVVPPTVTPQPTVRGVLRELGPPNGRDGHDQG